MHAVLDHQADGADTQQDQALKQGLGQPRPAEGGDRGRGEREGKGKKVEGEVAYAEVELCLPKYLDAFLHITTGPS